MASITWGVGGDKLATVFCIHCGAVFAADVPVYEAVKVKAETEPYHHCTPSKPCMAGRGEKEKHQF